MEDALADDRMVRVLEGREPAPFIFSVLYPSRRHVRVKTRLFTISTPLMPQSGQIGNHSGEIDSAERNLAIRRLVPVLL